MNILDPYSILDHKKKREGLLHGPLQINDHPSHNEWHAISCHQCRFASADCCCERAPPPGSASGGRGIEWNLVSERRRLGGKMEQVKRPPLLPEHEDAPDTVDESECIQGWGDQHLLNDAKQPPEFNPASDETYSNGRASRGDSSGLTT